jgi:hypothetical protein
MGQLNACSENGCHYFVKVKVSNCELPCGTNSPCPRNNGSDSQPIDEKSMNLHTLASMILTMHINTHIGHFLTQRETPSRRSQSVLTKKTSPELFQVDYDGF